MNVRGGSTSTAASKENTMSPDLKWRIQQQQLLQLRSTFLSETLAARGIPLTTMVDVSTLDGAKPPEEVDWDCAMSTERDPKVCLKTIVYFFFFGKSRNIFVYLTLVNLVHFLHKIKSTHTMMPCQW